jgi:hypothetical protein
MAVFYKIIQVPKRGKLKFKFARTYMGAGIAYFISVMDEIGNSYQFHMEEKDGLWVIMDDKLLPSWIKALEKELQKAVSSQESL